jgi:hypothetical protein
MCFASASLATPLSRCGRPQDKPGSLLLTADQDAYSVIGEVYGSLKLWDQVLTGGRFQVNQPEISPTDNRMTPNTYSGGNLEGTLAGINYYAAYLNATKPRNATNFINFVAAANINNPASEPLYLFGLSGQPQRIWPGDSPATTCPTCCSRTMPTWPGRCRWTSGIGCVWARRPCTKAAWASNCSPAASFSTWSGGLKADLSSGGATATLAYQQTGSGADYQAPYSGWAGYTYMIVKSFNLANMKAGLLGGTYDFAAQGVPGFVLNAAVVYGWDAIDPSSGAAQPNWTEYDLTLDYRFSDKRWPEWARPFWIRARAAYVDMRSAGDIEDYRIIVNYEWKF